MEVPDPKEADQLAAERSRALPRSWQEAAQRVAEDRPVEAGAHTHDSLVARRDDSPEAEVRWGQYTACSCDLAAEHQLVAERQVEVEHWQEGERQAEAEHW